MFGEIKSGASGMNFLVLIFLDGWGVSLRDITSLG